MTDFDEILERFEAVDEEIAELEAQMSSGAELPLEATLERSMGIVRGMLNAFGRHRGQEMPDTQDLLETFKAFVKSEPSLNAVRDNVRELVFYRNCVDMDRRDALPAKPERMAVRTARHIYLYLRTRLITESRQGAKPLKPM